MFGSMSYLTFHLVFILPVIGVLLLLLRSRDLSKLHGRWQGVAVLCTIAFIYTVPWDNYLVASDIWSYGEGRILEALKIGYVPIEEYAFFILQPIMTGCFLQWYFSNHENLLRCLTEPRVTGWQGIVGAIFFALLAGSGWVALEFGDQPLRYLALITVWACPVLAFQWGYGGATLIQFRQVMVPAVIVPSVYLWIVDMIAIEWRIWLIHEATSTGWKLFSLPVEEAYFFLVTNMLVVNGLVLYYQWVAARRAHSRQQQLPQA